MKSPKEIGYIWTGKKDKNGNDFMSGTLYLLGEEINIMLFTNPEKQLNEKAPDFLVVRAKKYDATRNSD